MRQEKVTQKQRIARLEKVSSMNYIRLHKVEEALRALQDKMGLGNGEEE
jgi:hypothetical protein